MDPDEGSLLYLDELEEAVVLDSVYSTASICHGLEQRGIYVCGSRLYPHLPSRGLAGIRLRPETLRHLSATGALYHEIVPRHILQEAKEVVAARRLDPEGERLYIYRQETVERSSAVTAPSGCAAWRRHPNKVCWEPVAE